MGWAGVSVRVKGGNHDSDFYLQIYPPWCFPEAQWVKNPPAMQEIPVRSLVWENPLEKGNATHIPVFSPGEFHGLYSPWSHKELDVTEQLSLCCPPETVTTLLIGDTPILVANSR